MELDALKKLNQQVWEDSGERKIRFKKPLQTQLQGLGSDHSPNFCVVEAPFPRHLHSAVGPRPNLWPVSRRRLLPFVTASDTLVIAARARAERGGAANERLSTVNSWRLWKKLSAKITGLPLELMAEPSAGSRFFSAVSVFADQPRALLPPTSLSPGNKSSCPSRPLLRLQLLPGFFCTRPPLIIPLPLVWNRPCEIISTPS